MDCLAYPYTAVVAFAETAVKLLPALARLAMADKFTNTIIVWVTVPVRCVPCVRELQCSTK